MMSKKKVGLWYIFENEDSMFMNSNIYMERNVVEDLYPKNPQYDLP